ncbi:MAG: RNA polymerase sigma factor [Planctomycetota bacterium]
MLSAPAPSEFAAVFEAYRDRVYRWAFGMSRRHADAGDVVQEVFLRLVQSRPHFETAGATIAWLRRATDRVLIDRWRSASAAARRDLDHGRQTLIHAAEPATDPIEDAQRERLMRAIQGLSAQQRLVLIAKHYDELSFSQIADEFGLSVPTAKTHYLRALQQLRTALAGSPGDFT